MHHHKTYISIIFQQNQVKTQVMTVHTNLFAKNRKLHKFAITNNTIQYNTIQYNTIQYNTIRYNTIQYNTIQYNTIQYNTTQYNAIIIMFKNRLFLTCIIVKRTCTCISIFSKIELVDQSKLCTQIYLQKKCTLLKFVTYN